MVDWPAVHDALLGRGFRQNHGPGSGRLRFDGEVRVGNFIVPLRISFNSIESVDLPRVQLLERPEWIPAVCHHLSRDLELCYPALPTASADPHKFAGNVMYAIDKSVSLLEEIRQGNATADIRHEFPSYWAGSPILLGAPPGTHGQELYVARVTPEAGGFQIIADAGSRAVYETAGLVDPGQWESVATFNVGLSDVPTTPVDVEWPPQHLHAMLSWLDQVSGDAVRSLRRALAWMYERKQRSLFVLFTTPGPWFGARLDLPPTVDPSKFTRSNRFAHLVAGATASKVRVTPFRIERVDPTYIVERNLPDGVPNLSGKRILMVGCGTIGGYLAEALVQVGAGSNGGALTLVDPQRLTAGNLGRHRLPLAALNRSKAWALAEVLKASYPWIDVVPVEGRVSNLPSLAGYDLVVDATGEFSVAMELNDMWCAHKIKAIVYVMVLGNGQGVQSFVCSDRSLGCRRCLEDKPDLIPVSPDAQQMRQGRGCDAAYAPFSVAAPHAAVAAAIEAVLDAISAAPQRSLRTIELDGDIRHVRTKIVEKHRGCPACSR